MKTNRTIAGWLTLLALSTLNLQPSTVFAQGTAFTYNGRLNDSGQPATGSYDLSFTLCDAFTNGNAVGALTNAATGVTNGLFMVTLDFGGVFSGTNYCLELAARTNGGASFSTLSPRQPITPTPYAIYAANASTAATATTATTAGSASSVAAAGIAGTIQVTQLPGTVLTNNQRGVTLNGSFSGNGGGLTNLNLTGLSANVALNNEANGYQALASNTTGSYNTANGSGALLDNTTGANNTAEGQAALLSNTTGNNNTAVGMVALLSNTTGNNNTAVGQSALVNNLTGNYNTANGARALQFNTTGDQNTASGYLSLGFNISGGCNTAYGNGTLQANSTGNNNAANGYLALWANTTGSDNTANGGWALNSNTTGFDNTANGQASLQYNTTGNNNSANGGWALYGNTNGSDNVANGYQALYSNTSGNQNTANGENALYSNTTGNNNIAEGYQAGYNITTGNNNIDIGNMGLATDTNIIRIGSSQTQAFIAGVITGNGGGLTNVSAASLTGKATLPAGVLPANVALLNSNQTFTGVNVFTNNLVVGTPASFINNFQVRPAANKILQIRTGVSVGSGMTIESLNDAASANMPLEFRGSPNVFTTGLVGIGTINPAMALDVNGSINSSGNVYLPATTASAGIIYSGGNTLMHNYGSQSVYVGSSAGNLTMSGGDNAALGAYALQSVEACTFKVLAKAWKKLPKNLSTVNMPCRIFMKALSGLVKSHIWKPASHPAV